MTATPPLTGAIVQARFGSVRLPGKVLADLGGKPMLERVLERVAAATRVALVVLATTADPEDTPLAALGEALGARVFRGSADDVLDRYHRAATAHGIDVIVRVTGDCPLVDPALIDRTVAVFAEGDCDYVSTSYPVATFPDGLDVEVFSRTALDRAWREARLGSEREHVTPYIWKHPRGFRLKAVTHAENLSAMRWTVDLDRDLEFVRCVYRRLEPASGPVFGMQEILDLLRRHPEIAAINRGIARNEGYEKSLQEDGEASRRDGGRGGRGAPA